MRKLAFAALAVGLAACKKAPPPAPETTPVPSASAAKAVAAVLDAGSKTAPLDAKAIVEHAAYLDALAKARKLAAQKKSKEAIAAFEDAAKREPANAQAWGEAGYARFLAGDPTGAEDDLEKARDCGAPPKLAAQIWFNLGLVREKQLDQEGARSAFVISRSLAPTKAVLAKIGSAPECVAEISFAHPDLDLQQATSWQDAASKLALTIDVEPKDEDGWKRAVCTTPAGFDPANATHDACDGPAPWTIARDYLFFTESANVVFPGPGTNLFLSETERVGGWPAHCNGSASVRGTMDPSFDVLTDSFDGHGGAMLTAEDVDAGVGIDVIDNGDLFCGDSAGFVEDTFFEHGTGRMLLRIRREVAVAANDSEVSLTRSGSIVKLTGAGCDKTFDLSALSKDAGTR